MKHIIGFILILFFYQNTQAQNKEGEIIYDDSKDLIAQLPDDMKGLAAMLPPKLHIKTTVVFNCKNALSESQFEQKTKTNTAKNSLKYIVDAEKKKIWSLQKDSELSYREVYPLNFARIKKTGQKKKIAGLTCWEAKLVGKDIFIWFCPKLPKHVSPVSTVYTQEGAIMAYENKAEGTSIIAQEIKLKEINKKNFDILGEYKLLEKKENRKENETIGVAVPIKKGALFPVFKMIDLEGNSWNAKMLKGKVVVFNFWYAACQPCRAEIPDLNKIATDYKEDNIVFLAVSIDDWEKAAYVASKVNFDYHIIPNAKKWVKDLGITAFPTHVILDREGQVVLKESGAKIELLREMLNQLK